jgi:hypothetical protein
MRQARVISKPQESIAPRFQANPRDRIGKLTLVLIGLSLDFLGQFLKLFGFLNNIEREDVDVHLVQLVAELVG